MAKLKADPAYIDSVLAKGAQRANSIAQPILREVKEIVGFLNS
jgi:tryptophanyl-tRNA synthetase